MSAAVREVLAAHFIMWRELPDFGGTPSGEWFCACGLKFGFSDTAIDHQAAMLATPPEPAPEPNAGDMAALAEVLLLPHGHAEWDLLDAEVMSVVIITSDWLAAVKARAAREAVHKLADEVDPNGYGWTSVRDAERFKQRLRDRADRDTNGGA